MLKNLTLIAKICFDPTENAPPRGAKNHRACRTARAFASGGQASAGCRVSPRKTRADALKQYLLGSSGIKFEVEGGEGSLGADTYIPLHQKIAILQHFSETFRKMLYFGEIPKKFGQN